MQTNIDINDDNAQAFWAGIALENCRRTQLDEQLADTTAPPPADTTDSLIANLEHFTCKALFDFMMKNKMSSRTHSLWGRHLNPSLERYTEIFHDSTGRITSGPNICILPSQPPRPLIFLVDIPNDLQEPLMQGVSLIDKHFTDVQTIDVQWEQNPETEEEWIAIEVTIEDEVDKVLDKYDNYTDEWISLVPWTKREKIRFSYDII